jgi:WD40 repeat protein
VNVHDVSADGRTLASGSSTNTVRLWNVADPAHPTRLGPPLTGHTDYVRNVQVSAGDQLAAEADVGLPTPKRFLRLPSSHTRR